MRIFRDKVNEILKLSQEEYVKKVLSRFTKPTWLRYVPYSSTIGCLMYAIVCTRPDIAHAVGVVSRYINNL